MGENGNHPPQLNMVLGATTDRRLYNPNRDIAHCFLPMLKIVEARLENGVWGAVEEVLEHFGVENQALSDGWDAYVRFMSRVCGDSQISIADAAKVSGWDEVPGCVQVCLLAMLGTVVGGYFWAGAKEVTLCGQGPAADAAALAETGELMYQEVCKIPGRRVAHDILGTLYASLLNTNRVLAAKRETDRLTFFDVIDRQYYEVAVVLTEKPSDAKYTES